MVPRCIFMQPSAISQGSSGRSVTYRQNNFYGASKPSCVWTCGSSPYYMGAGCGMPYYSYMPDFARNAMTRLTGFNLMQYMMNLGKQTDSTPLLADSTTVKPDDLKASTSEIDEINNRYNTSA